jgi:hypothetical protein
MPIFDAGSSVSGRSHRAWTSAALAGGTTTLTVFPDTVSA